MKRQTGIWLDFECADIIFMDNGFVSTQTVNSNIESYNVKGGSRSKTPYGPMEKVSESKYLEKRNQQANNYYHDIYESIKDSDSLYIMGPAEAKIGLRKYLLKMKDLKPEILGVETKDQMTLKQKVASVKSFFGVAMN